MERHTTIPKPASLEVVFSKIEGPLVQLQLAWLEPENDDKDRQAAVEVFLSELMQAQFYKLGGEDRQALYVKVMNTLTDPALPKFSGRPLRMELLLCAQRHKIFQTGLAQQHLVPFLFGDPPAIGFPRPAAEE